MNDDQAKTLGATLRIAREALGLSTRQLSERSGVDQAAVVRLENGTFTTPSPDKLARVTEALGLNLADVYTLAGYTVPSDLPSFKPYLRTKYGTLPQDEIDKIEAYAARLARKHGISLNGPAPGEDEA